MEYKKSLKHLEIEELLDLYFFRILGYGFVKLIARTSVTPNQVTYLGMAFGVLSGYFFSIGTEDALMTAAVLLLLANVMDCADGQLARLKKNGTQLGSMIDGLFDYIVGAASILGIGAYLSHHYPLHVVVPLTVLAGCSRSIQNLLLDLRRRFYTDTSALGDSPLMDDYDKSVHDLRRLRYARGHLAEKFVLRLSLVYFAAQRLTIRLSRINSTDFRMISTLPDDKSLIMRLWTLVGSSTHISFVIVAAFFNHLEVYFWAAITTGNLIVIILLLVETYLVHRIESTTMEVK